MVLHDTALLTPFRAFTSMLDNKLIETIIDNCINYLLMTLRVNLHSPTGSARGTLPFGLIRVLCLFLFFAKSGDKLIIGGAVHEGIKL